MANDFSALSTMDNFIPLSQAIVMTKRHRDNREMIMGPDYQNQDLLAICETFNRTGFDTLLLKPDCAGIRIYYGMDESLKVHAIVVAVNANGEDLIPINSQSSNLNAAGVGEEDVLDDALRCPTFCPPPSPLNEN